MTSKHIRRLSVWGALASGFIVYLAADILSNMIVKGTAFGVAASEFFAVIASAPQEPIFLLLPFLLVAISVFEVTEKKVVLRQALVAGGGVLVLAALYFSGYNDYYSYLENKKWTAAAITKGFMSFKGIAIALVVMLLTFLIRKRKNET